MNPDQLPSVSTFRVEKPGKSKFAPSIGGRKAVPVSSSTPDASKDATAKSSTVSESTTISYEREQTTTNDIHDDSMANDFLNSPLLPASSSSSSSTVGKKIESIQSRRMAATITSNSFSSTQPDYSETTKSSIKMPSGPKDAASIATSTSTGSGAEKRTMAYFLKDSGEGREMPGTSAASSSSESSAAPLSPSKTRRIVNLRNIKAPPRSAATSTALAPQVRVVDGAIVYDEKFSAALSIPSAASATADIEQELEYVDEDDENGKHLTSATYSTRAKGSNRWSPAETDLFYEALSMCGTDFSMVQTLFPHRTRPQIKGKYKLEEKSNPNRINAALRNKKAFDPTFKDRVREFAESSLKK